MVRDWVLALLLFPFILHGQDRFYIGALSGVATLSADAAGTVSANTSGLSQYKPENGAAVDVFAGMHFNNYLSGQANFIWNQNGITLTSSLSSGSGNSIYQQSRTSSQQAFIGDVLLYFRNRRSWVRPYLSLGIGLARIASDAEETRVRQGDLQVPAAHFDATKPVLRTAVGIDLALKRGWWLRYSFSETLRKNPFSEQLTPRGGRNLANFQNLFGFVKTF